MLGQRKTVMDTGLGAHRTKRMMFKGSAHTRNSLWVSSSWGPDTRFRVRVGHRRLLWIALLLWVALLVSRVSLSRECFS